MLQLFKDNISQVRSITCHVGSHSVNCHTTQENTPNHNPSQTDQYSIYLSWKDKN